MILPEGTILKAMQDLENLRVALGAKGAVVGFGVHQADMRDDIDHYSVALRFPEGVFSGAAIHLDSCIRLAQSKRDREVSRLAKAREERRDAKRREASPHDVMYDEELVCDE